MTGQISTRQALALRMRSQGLAGERGADVAGAVRRAAGLQGQDTRASRLAVRARSDGLDLPAVLRAANTERTVVRSWLMRGTLHMAPAEDVAWLTALLGPAMLERGRRRRRQLGLDDDTCARSLPALRAILGSGGPHPRADLVRALAEHDVRVNPAGQAPAHLVFYAAASGLICRGPDQPDDEPTYVLLDDWVGDRAGPEPADPLAELARRHLTAFGPATAADFAAWAGVPLTQARAAVGRVAGEFTEVRLDGVPAWLAGDVTGSGAAGRSAPAVRLLPAFDTYLLGYRSRDLALDPAFGRRIHAGGGWIHPAVLADGRVVGTWRQRRSGKGRLTVAVGLFEPAGRGLRGALAEETADLGRFLGTEAVLEIADQALAD